MKLIDRGTVSSNVTFFWIVLDSRPAVLGPPGPVIVDEKRQCCDDDGEGPVVKLMVTVAPVTEEVAAVTELLRQSPHHVVLTLDVKYLVLGRTTTTGHFTF